MFAQNHATSAPSRSEFIALLAMLMALNALAIDIILPALPQIGGALHIAGGNEQQLVISAYLLGFGLAQLFFGPLSDRFGRRAPLFVGLAIYLSAAAAAVFAPNFAVLLALRFIQGLGAASTRVIATAVVRDRFVGADMAATMSLIMAVFMTVPVLAPSLGQVILLFAGWKEIFLFMTGLAALVFAWSYWRLPETLAPTARRALKPRVILQGFAIVLGQRRSLFYGLGSMFAFGGLMGFVMGAQQIFVDIYGLGAYFPLAFAVLPIAMGSASVLNSAIVRRVGLRRLCHAAVCAYVLVAGTLLLMALAGALPLAAFMVLLMIQQFVHGFVPANMNALAMEPLGKVAGTAAAVLGAMQTVGAGMIGTAIGQQFDGSLVPHTAGFFVMGCLLLACTLAAEKGRLFGSAPTIAPVPVEV